MHLDDLSTPALLLDIDKLDRNLGWMAERATSLGVLLRPHVKTHKCIEIGKRQLNYGARGITVSTLHEARAFADNGFNDITWAFPVIPSRIREACELTERTRLQLVIDSEDTLTQLERCGTPFPVWVKADCGYHRAGVDPKGNLPGRLARMITDSPRLEFAGLLSHSGHAYNTTGDVVSEIAEEERAVMVTLAERLRAEGIFVPGISVGSTPAMRKVKHLDGVSEARPGNYALFDFSQVAIGSCTPSECAATILTTVVSSQPTASHCIVDAGALALSKDPGPPPPFGPTMGETFADYDAGTLSEEVRIVSLSQEHGRVRVPLKVGTRLRVLPNHSCLTVAQFNELVVVQGETVVERWRVWNGRSLI
jgi:D-serine deaminase-like pyridoxal phosphate-dependent protein